MTETKTAPDTKERYVEISHDGGKTWKPLAVNSAGLQKSTFLKTGDMFRMYLPDKSKKVTLKGQHELTVNRGGYVGMLGILSLAVKGFVDPLDVARGITPAANPVATVKGKDEPGAKAKVS